MMLRAKKRKRKQKINVIVSGSAEALMVHMDAGEHWLQDSEISAQGDLY